MGALAEGDTAHDFLGPVQPDAVMQKVAEGTESVVHSAWQTENVTGLTGSNAMTAFSTVVRVSSHVMQSSCHETSAAEAMMSTHQCGRVRCTDHFEIDEQLMWAPIMSIEKMLAGVAARNLHLCLQARSCHDMHMPEGNTYHRQSGQ